jgi:hypothetical protein
MKTKSIKTKDLKNKKTTVSTKDKRSKPSKNKSDKANKDNQLDKVHKGITIDKILSLKAENPRLTQEQLAKLLGCNRTNIISHLRQHNIEWSELSQGLETFKKNKADVLAFHQRRILSHLSEEKLQKSSAYQLVGMFGSLHDKEQEMRGKHSGSQGIWALIVKQAAKEVIDITPKKEAQLIPNQLSSDDKDEE